MTSIRTFKSLLIATVLFAAGCEPSNPNTATSLFPSLPSVTQANFESEVMQSPQPILVEVGVDFACARCETMKPRVADVAQQFAGQAKVVRMDFRANTQFVQQFGVVVCPTYLVFHEGKVVDSLVGEVFTPVLSAKLAAVVDQVKPAPR